MEKQDITLFDLLIKIEKSTISFIKNSYKALLFLIKLSYTYLWIICICLGIGIGISYTFHNSKFYKRDLITTIRYPYGMDDEVQHALKQFMNMNYSLLEEKYEMPIKERKQVKYIQMVNAIDTHNDGILDFYDYSNTISPDDSIHSIMHDRTRIIIHTKGLKTTKNIAKSLNLFFINEPRLKSHFKRFHVRDIETLSYLDREIDRIDKLSNETYFNSNQTIEIKNNLLITPAEKQLLFEDIITLRQKRDLLKEQISAAPERVLFEYDFIVSCIPLVQLMKIGGFWGLVLGYLLSFLVKFRKPIHTFLNSKENERKKTI